jgi:hypothetical protein
MSRCVKTTPITRARKPLAAALTAVQRQKARRWSDVEAGFLAAMHKFDRVVAAGDATQGDRQNGKGDFLNDVLAQLLVNCSGKDLHTRPNVPGLSFKKNKLDIAYPRTGLVQLCVETKATGIPKHPGNTSQKHPDGRAGSADLEKRIKEAALKNIDIKGETARKAAQGQGAVSDLATWIQAAPPQAYLFLACRVRDDADRQHCVRFARIAKEWFNGVGLFCYGWDDGRRTYEAKSVEDTSVEFDRALHRLCTALRALPTP